MAASRLVIAAAALAGAWLAGLHASPPPSAAQRPVRAAVAPARAAAPAALVPAPAAAILPKPAAEPPPQAIAPAALLPLLEAPGVQVRQGLESALRQRAQGGRLYARALARRCAALDALPPDAPAAPTDARWLAAQQRRSDWAAGCAQLAPAEWLALASVAGDEAGAPDPLLTRLESDRGQPGWLADILDRPDPLLLDELGTGLLARDGEAYLFAGRRFESEDERRLIEAALRLLPCDFGLACDERDPAVWLECLRTAVCHGSRAEQVLAAAGPDGPPPLPAAAVLALRDQLRAAVRSRDAARLGR